MKITQKELRTFKELPDIVADYLAEVSPADLVRQRQPPAWTIQEHLYHIVDVQAMLLRRMETIISQEHPVIEPYFPEADVAKGFGFESVDQAIASYREYRRIQLKTLRRATAADLAKRAEHKEYTQYSLPILVKHMIFHEFWHLYRIEEIWLTRDEYFR